MSPDQDIAMSNGIMAPNGNSEPLEYYYQKQLAWCGHTINRFGKGSPNLDKQYKAGKIPRLFLNDMCSNCTARQKLSGQSPDTHISVLRSQINGYVTKLDDNSREAVDMRASLSNADAELEKLSERVKQLSSANTQLSQKANPQGSELEKLREKFRQLQTEHFQLNGKYNQQSAEVGTLRNKVREQSQRIIALTNGSQAEDLKKARNIAAIGFTNPIATGLTALKNELANARWEPYVRSLFTELEEAVRRKDYDEKCDILERLHSFAEAFDTDFKEKVEKAEKEILKQCDEGVKRLLSTMF